MDLIDPLVPGGRCLSHIGTEGCEKTDSKSRSIIPILLIIGEIGNHYVKSV